MIFKIDRKERNTFEKYCSVMDLDVRFFTMETNNNLIQAEVLDRGREVTPITAYHLGRETGMQRMSNAII